MTAYTPLFHSLTTGTLCGRWPDIGLWPIVLSLSDRQGVVDVTHQYISTITGLPLKEVVDCMSRFCEPDPESRTSDAKGCRLELIDSNRQWGWRIINYRKYSEKVRLIHKNARETETGKNKARMQDRRGPPSTARDRPSNSNSSSNVDPPAGGRRASKRCPDDFIVTVEMYEWACAECELDAERVNFETAKMKDHEFAKAKKDWSAVWRNWMRRCKKEGPRETRKSGSFEDVHARNRKAAGLD